MTQPPSIKLAVVAAMAALTMAAPAQACRTLVAPDHHWKDAVAEAKAVAIVRVTALHPHTPEEMAKLRAAGTTAPGGTLAISDNSGNVDLRVVQVLHGKAEGTVTALYDAGPSCGLNWSPKVGESLMVLIYDSGWVETWPLLHTPVDPR